MEMKIFYKIFSWLWELISSQKGKTFLYAHKKKGSSVVDCRLFIKIGSQLKNERKTLVTVNFTKLASGAMLHIKGNFKMAEQVEHFRFMVFYYLLYFPSESHVLIFPSPIIHNFFPFDGKTSPLIENFPKKN